MAQAVLVKDKRYRTTFPAGVFADTISTLYSPWAEGENANKFKKLLAF